VSAHRRRPRLIGYVYFPGWAAARVGLKDGVRQDHIFLCRARGTRFLGALSEGLNQLALLSEVKTKPFRSRFEART